MIHTETIRQALKRQDEDEVIDFMDEVMTDSEGISENALIQKTFNYWKRLAGIDRED